MINLLIYPSSYFNINEIEENLKVEYSAAIETGLFDIVLFDYEKFIYKNKMILSHPIKTKRMAIYRGWMMKPEQYEQFYEMLLENNIQLVTSSEEYELMHIFPNVYKYMFEDTAKMEMYSLHQNINVEKLKENFDRFMVKDYVKSVKGTEFPRYFDRSITQEEFDKWMEVFYKYRGNLLTGGICIKQFLNLKRYGSYTNEYRVFYINHQVATVSRNSGQGIYAPLPPEELIEKYKNFSSPYYTIDYAELEDGSWKILEAGDGSVSGLSENQDVKSYYRVLYQCFN